MEGLNKIHGENLPEEAKEQAAATLEKLNAESRRTIEGEIEKTPEQFAFIREANGYIAREFAELGIEDPPVIAPELIHFLTEKVYKKMLDKRQQKTTGISFNLENKAYVNLSVCHRIQLFKTTMHEMIHLMSAKTIIADPEKAVIAPYRTGYNVFGKKLLFHGLDEAVVDRTAMEILQSNWDKISADFKISEEETEKSKLHYYENYIVVLDEIMETIAGVTGESYETVWRRFKKGLFTGELMHLRDIERIYGKDALRILALMGDEEDAKKSEKTLRLIKEYFGEGVLKAREEIARKIFGES